MNEVTIVTQDAPNVEASDFEKLRFSGIEKLRPMGGMEGIRHEMIPEGVNVAKAIEGLEVEKILIPEEKVFAEKIDTGSKVSAERRLKRLKENVVDWKEFKKENGIGKYVKPVEEVKVVEEKGIEVHYALNECQKASIELRDFYEKRGIKVTDDEIRFVKREIAKVGNCKCLGEGMNYLKILANRTNNRGMMIILAVMIHVIQGRAEMDANDRAYQLQAVAFARTQTLNLSGFFGTPFPGNALLITRAGIMLTCIEN